MEGEAKAPGTGQPEQQHQARARKREAKKRAMKELKEGKAVEGETCLFFVKSKGRHCAFPPLPGKRFCSHHIASTNGVDLDRMPCVVDPSHTAKLKGYRKHCLQKCNALQQLLSTRAQPYWSEGCNMAPQYRAAHPPLSTEEWMAELKGKVEAALAKAAAHPESVSDQMQESARASKRPRVSSAAIRALPSDRLLALLAKIEAVHSRLADEVQEPTTPPRPCVSKGDRHTAQCESIVALMRDSGTLPKGPAAYVEFGAGKGVLTFNLVANAARGSSFWMIDRSSFKHTFDHHCKLEGEAVRPHRLGIDIQHVNLANVPGIRDSGPVVGSGKHLCGGATDLALRCLCTARQDGLQVAGVCIALCCHHLCDEHTYVAMDMLKEFELDSHLALIARLSSWAVCGKKDNPPEGNNDNDDNNDGCQHANPPSLEKLEGLEHLSAEQLQRVGLQCKHILNAGRARFLRANGFSASLVQFVDAAVTPENVLLVAKHG